MAATPSSSTHSLSPPVRASQPRPDSETTAGACPKRVLYDQTPSDQESEDLGRSKRIRKPSSRKVESDRYLSQTGQGKNSQSQAPAGSKATSKSAKRRKRAIVQSAESDDDEDTSAGQTCNKSTSGNPSRSKSGAHGAAVAGGVGTHAIGAKRSLTLGPDAARDLGELLGIDIATASTKTIHDTVKTFADSGSYEMENSRRYPQVRGETPAPLSALNKTGGYYRPRLEQLDPPESSQGTKKRPGSPDIAELSKRQRRETHAESDADDMYDDYNPLLPPLPPRLQFDLDPPSATSTQGAIVSAFRSQPRGTERAYVADPRAKSRGLAVTPVPTPRDFFSQLPTRNTAVPSRNYATSVEETSRTPRVPVQQPKPSPAPDPDTATESESESDLPLAKLRYLRAPEVHGSMRTTKHPTPIQTTSRHSQPHTSSSCKIPQGITPRPAANNNTDTESETESPPPGKPSHSHTTRAGGSTHPTHRLSGVAANTKPCTQPKPCTHDIQPSNPPPHQRSEDLMQRLNDILAGGGDQDAVVNWALHFADQREQRAGPGPSSLRGQCGAASDIRARVRGSAVSHTPNQARRNVHYPPTAQTPPSPIGCDLDLPPEHDVSLSASAPASSEAEPSTASSKSGLGKYPGTRQRVAARAIIELLATAVRKGVYQPADIFQEWALNCYRRAWKQIAHNESYEDPPEDLLKTMVYRISWLRTKVKERIRPVVRYKLKFRQPGGSDKKKARNRQRFAKLFPNTFHCRDLKTDTEQYQSTAFVTSICEAFFWVPDSPIIRHHNMFIRVPLAAAAFVLTMMQACLEEWSSGTYQPQDLHAPTQEPIFDAHLRGLLEYKKSAPARMHEFQDQWFKHGMSYAGITIHDDQEPEYCQPITRACNVRPDTPVHDLTPPPELDENGRFTAWAKGKGPLVWEETDSESE